MTHDDATRSGSPRFRAVGTGHAVTRHCMPGNHNVAVTQGSKYLSWRGAKVWTCAGCVEARERRRAGEVAA